MKIIPFFSTVFSTYYQVVKFIMQRNYSKHKQIRCHILFFSRLYIRFFRINIMIKTLNILKFLNFILIIQIRLHCKSFFDWFFVWIFFPHEMNSLIRDVLEGWRGGRRPPKSFFRLGGRIMAVPTQEPRKKLQIVKNLISKFLTMIILIIK